MDQTTIAMLLAAIRHIVREELTACGRPVPAELSEKRRAAALARWEKPKKRTKNMQSDAIAMQKDASASEAWRAYQDAYCARYGVPPVRNATVNSQMKQFVGRVGAEEAPAIARWYVQSNVARRVAAKHSVGLLLMDGEGIRTEWAIGRDVTQHEAAQKDRTQANGNVWNALIEEARHAG